MLPVIASPKGVAISRYNFGFCLGNLLLNKTGE